MKDTEHKQVKQVYWGTNALFAYFGSYKPHYHHYYGFVISIVFFFVLFCFVFVFLPFLGLLPQHMEVPRLEVESEL